MNQPETGCPAVCARWNTVLKSNGQMENTPVVTSPMIPGDTITQCPKQCDPKCCNTAGQTFTQVSDGSPGLQSDHDGHPPACMAGCPKACYPACRPGCCNGAFSSMMSMYQQNMGQPQTPMMQPMTQPIPQMYAPQPALPAQTRETIPRPAMLSYAPQEMNEPIPAAPYTSPDITPVSRSSISYPSTQYNYPQYEAMMSQTRATIPQPDTSYVAAGQPAQQRTKISHDTATVHAATCPIPCSPMCAPHCTKHCCESYD